jgi:hypothetical protein
MRAWQPEAPEARAIRNLLGKVSNDAIMFRMMDNAACSGQHGR